MIERILLAIAVALASNASCKRTIEPEERKVGVSTTPRELDERIAERIQMSAMGEREEKDVFPQAKERVDFFNDDGQGRIAGSYWVERVQIDLDRDGRWDEKWTRTLEHGRVETKRLVAPADDEKYTETWLDRDDGKGWQPAP